MEIRQAINLYLTAKAYGDAEFKAKFENPSKNLDECLLYVKYQFYKRAEEKAMKEKKNCCQVVIPSDDEIFAYAEQYYTDEDLKIEGDTLEKVKVVSAAAVTFTEEEKAQQRQEAIKKYQDAVIAEMKKKDEERKNKCKKKEKKPTTPVLVPDTTENDNEPKKDTKAEDKPKAVQMDLFG